MGAVEEEDVLEYLEDAVAALEEQIQMGLTDSRSTSEAGSGSTSSDSRSRSNESQTLEYLEGRETLT